MKTVQIELPETLADEAAEAGLLAPAALERMLRETLRAARIERFKQLREILGADDPPVDLDEQIAAEIDAVRAEKRAAGS